MAKKTVRKTTKTGEYLWLHFFLGNNGKIVQVECTQAEYLTYQAVGAVPPKHGNDYHLGSGRFDVFDGGKPKKDDAIVEDNGDVTLVVDDLHYFGSSKTLTVAEYAPVIIGTTLHTNKPIPGEQ